MATDWDLFVDEHKSGGKITLLGIVAVNAGTVEGLLKQLYSSRIKRAGRRVTVGEVKWSGLGKVEADVAREWLSFFLRGPLMFFALLESQPGETRAAGVRRFVELMEADPAVPGELDRKATTVHLDIDLSESHGTLKDLRRDFGLLRAFHWDSKSSLILQLSDLLIGLAAADASGELDVEEKDLSEGRKIRKGVLEHARSEARRLAGPNRNAVIRINTDSQIRELLKSQSRF
jgi:hypothetical protein